MARTFNRAYDQANRILNGSGLSSIVYRQDGGDLSGWDMGDWAEAQMAADTGPRGGDIITTEDFQIGSPDDNQPTRQGIQILPHVLPNIKKDTYPVYDDIFPETKGYISRNKSYG